MGNLVSFNCPPLNRITLGQPKSDNNNRLIRLTNVFVYCLDKVETETSEYNKRLILLSVIQLSVDPVFTT